MLQWLRIIGLWPSHPESVVPTALPTTFQHCQIHRGKQIPVYGSKTSGSPAEPEEWMMTTSSFNTSPSTWGNMFERGSNSSRTIASATGWISRGSSLEIFRGPMSILGIPRTSRAASRSPMSPYGITSIGSPNDATPSLMLLMWMLSMLSSSKQPVSL